ncbi:MAG: hypothetical protein JWM02_3676 [Frankiales bacterium]|nr:hypothetical protein [Frankiales bacterium]
MSADQQPSVTVGQSLTPKSERPVGLIQKYHVQRANDTTGKHDSCRYFVLDPLHDPLAYEALVDYATYAREAGFQSLYDDLLNWLATIPTPSNKAGNGEAGEQRG